ncbi:MAG: NADPH:quinone oxidoreductase family protein [Actinomycetes bacterium]
MAGTIRAWQVSQLGNPESAMSLETIAPPKRSADQVLISVRACALNFADSLLCAGTYQERPPLPFTPGLEVCGTVLESPSHSPFRVGDRVIALPRLPDGGLAEQTVADLSDVFAIPESLNDLSAAALPVTYQTSWFGLFHRADLQAGETVLIHAGAGGTGSAAIQLAVARGARVIATAGGSAKTALCRELGADVVIDYRTEDFVSITNDATNGHGANVIFDSVGGETFTRSRKCIAFEGRIVVVGFAGGEIAEAPTNHLMVKNYGVLGLHWGNYRNLQPTTVHECHDDLMRLHAAGNIDPVIGAVLPLEEAAIGLSNLMSRGTVGKVILTTL